MRLGFWLDVVLPERIQCRNVIRENSPSDCSKNNTVYALMKRDGASWRAIKIACFSLHGALKNNNFRQLCAGSGFRDLSEWKSRVGSAQIVRKSRVSPLI